MMMSFKSFEISSKIGEIRAEKAEISAEIVLVLSGWVWSLFVYVGLLITHKPVNGWDGQLSLSASLLRVSYLMNKQSTCFNIYHHIIFTLHDRYVQEVTRAQYPTVLMTRFSMPSPPKATTRTWLASHPLLTS